MSKPTPCCKACVTADTAFSCCRLQEQAGVEGGKRAAPAPLLIVHEHARAFRHSRRNNSMQVHIVPPPAGLQKLAGVAGGEDEVNKLVAASIPVGHVGARWDIAIAAVFLASPAARFISGAP